MMMGNVLLVGLPTPSACVDPAAALVADRPWRAPHLEGVDAMNRTMRASGVTPRRSAFVWCLRAADAMMARWLSVCELADKFLTKLNFLTHRSSFVMDETRSAR